MFPLLISICFTVYDWLILNWLIVHKEMASRNDRAIDDVLEEITNMMAQANVALHANQKGGADEFCGLQKFQRNNLHTSEGRYDPRGFL